RQSRERPAGPLGTRDQDLPEAAGTRGARRPDRHRRDQRVAAVPADHRDVPGGHRRRGDGAVAHLKIASDARVERYRSDVFELSHPIRTARMTLRPYEPGDLGAIHDLFGREDVSRYLIWEPMSVEQARAKLEQRVLQTRIETDGDALLFAAAESE